MMGTSMNGSETIQLLEYLRAVRRRWRLVALVALIVTGAALGVSLSSDKQYDASVDLLLRGEEPINTLLVPDAGSGSGDPERDLNTEVELIEVAGTAHAARRKLGFIHSTDVLLDKVETETSNTSNIVTLKARDRDPRLAARIANAFAEAYVEFRVSSARARYARAADLAQRQLLALSPEERRTTQGRELQSRQRELQIAAALQTGGAEIVRRASVPASPSRPRPKLSGALGILLGLLLGVGIALARELVDRRFKDQDTIEAFFGLPILAAIPRPPRRGATREDHAQREAFGLLAANLRLSAPPGRSGSVLMVTSPSPAEGKTSVTLGIARACARLGLRVVAIEADLRRPAFSRFLDVGVSLGLTGVLARPNRLEKELLWMDAELVASLASGDGDAGMIGLLPAGEVPDSPQRALSQPAMGATIEVARSLADIVLIDTAPVGTVNDAITMSHLVDGVVLVARLNQTTKDAARRALRVLRNVDVRLPGVVVTDAGLSERYGYYGRVPGDAPLAGEPLRSGAESRLD